MAKLSLRTDHATGRAILLASKLFGSTVLAQIAVLAATAVATSRITPADFSAYGVVSGAASLTASFNTLAAETRAPVLDQHRADAVLRGGYTSTAVISALWLLAAIPGLVLGSDWGVTFLLSAGCSFLLGAHELLTAVLLRHQDQIWLARGRLSQGLINAVLILSLLVLPLGGFIVLPLAWFMSLIVGDAVLWRGTRCRFRDLRPASREDMRILLSEVRSQPIANVLAGAVAPMPLLLLPVVGDRTFSGAWAVVDRFLNPIVNTAFNTLQPLYYGRGAELIRTGHPDRFGTYHAMWVRRLLLLAIPVTIGFFGVITWGLPLFGDEWRVGSLVAVQACLNYVSLFVCLPLSQTLLLLGGVRTQFNWTVLRFVCCGASFAVAWVCGPGLGLTLWAISAAATYFLQIVLQRRRIRMLTSGLVAQQ